MKNKLENYDYFKEELEDLNKQIQAISNGSFKRSYTNNYSFNMNEAYNGLINYALELKVVAGLVNKERLIRKINNCTKQNAILNIQHLLISTLDIL